MEEEAELPQRSDPVRDVSADGPRPWLEEEEPQRRPSFLERSLSSLGGMLGMGIVLIRFAFSSKKED